MAPGTYLTQNFDPGRINYLIEPGFQVGFWKKAVTLNPHPHTYEIYKI